MTTPSIFNQFDSIRIINLAHRVDRRREMERQLQRVNQLGNPAVRFHSASSPTDAGLFQSRGAHGCYLSHISILQEAANADRSVLILEDDCDFLQSIYQYSAPPEWDVLYGGYLVASDETDLQNSDIIGSHFMGFSARAAKAAVLYFSSYGKLCFEGDPKAVIEASYNPKIRPPIDGGYVWFRRAHPELATEFSMLSTQRASRTDIGEQRFFDRMPVLRDIANIARKAHRKLA